MKALEKYRSDIDGLRAVAIIAIVAYHAFPGRIRGGFVGVDVFFVISGYLILASYLVA
jgi:peptidoglycan/LPS O-acetylase OafA/YrhL